MKNRLKIFLTVLGFVSVSLYMNAQDKMIPEDQLPDVIRSYVKTHFPNNAIMQAEVDKEYMSKSYEVYLQNNIKLEFNSKNQIKEIDGNSQLPESVIPKEIDAYVMKNYPNNVITDWELDDYKQKVKLDNGMKLKFNMKGDFLRIDD